MKKLLKIFAILMISALVFSCGGSGGSAEGDAPVKVSLNVETPHGDIAKTVSVNSPGNSFTYEYAAIPQWTGADFGTIQGHTGGTDANPNYVPISNYLTDNSIGLFAQGSWKFYARVKSGDSVIYKGNTNIVYINSESTSVTVNVERQAAGTATVSIDIEVPDTSANAVLLASYSGDGSGSISLTKGAAVLHTGGGWSRFTGTSSALTTGSYLFTLTSRTDYDAQDATVGAAVGGASLAFDVIGGVNRTITGTIESGAWQTAEITINIPTFTVNIQAANNNPITTSGSMAYTCSASATNTTGTISYQWYVNDTAVTSNGTSSTYTFSSANPGYYYVACKAYISGKLAGSAMLPITVNPAP